MLIGHLRLLLSATAIALPAAAVLTCAEPATAQDGLPVTLFAYDRAAPLALEESAVSEDSASRFLRVSFVSPGGGRVTGFLAVPKAPGPHPGVVVMHGLPGSADGAMGALFVGIERRLRASVLFVPDGGLVAHFTGADGSFLGPVAALDEAARARWLAAMTPIEPIRFVARANAPILFQNGRQDQLVSVEDAAALHTAAPAESTVRWYDAGHGLTLAARSDRLAWLAERIGIMP